MAAATQVSMIPRAISTADEVHSERGVYDSDSYARAALELASRLTKSGTGQRLALKQLEVLLQVRDGVFREWLQEALRNDTLSDRVLEYQFEQWVKSETISGNQ